MTSDPRQHRGEAYEPFRKRLGAYFGDRLRNRDLRLESWRLAGQGMSDETLFATLRDGARVEELVLRRYREDGVARELTDLERQFRLLRALRPSGIPVADALWFEGDTSILGTQFFVMRRTSGFVPVPWSPEGRVFLARAGDGPIGEQFVSILAAIHRLDWEAYGLGFLPRSSVPDGFAREEVARLAGLVRLYRQEPEPILEDALGWLAAHAPTSGRSALVHGDYRTGNMIYDGDRIAAVLDWEFATVGDPTLDLGWVCARSNRMESERVCYILPANRFLDSYEAATGWRPDATSLRFWEVYHLVKNTMIWQSAADGWAKGRTHDLRLARWALTLPVMRGMISEMLESS